MRLFALAVGIVAFVASAPPASAAPTVQDEYTLDLPGYGEDASERTVLGGPDAIETAPQQGVAGELEEASSPLSSTFATLGGEPVLLALAFALALLAAARLVRARLRRPSLR